MDQTSDGVDGIWTDGKFQDGGFLVTSVKNEGVHWTQFKNNLWFISIDFRLLY